MPKIANLLLLVVGVALAGLGLATASTDRSAWAVMALGAVVGTLALASDVWRKRRALRRQQAALPARIDELMRQVLRGHPLRLPMPFRLVLVDVLALIGGAWVLYLAGTGTANDWRLTVAGALFFGSGLVLLPTVWIGLGRPAIELGASGIATPKTGRIAWADITGVFLRTITYQGASSHMIMFRVDHFARAAQRIFWTDRVLASIHRGPLLTGIVAAPLPRRKEDPAVVYALARGLWTLATGNDYDWNPLMSDRYNAASQRLAALRARMHAPESTEAAPENFQRIDRDLGRARDDLALIRDESRRRLARSQWILGLVLIVALLAIAAPPILRLWSH